MLHPHGQDKWHKYLHQGSIDGILQLVHNSKGRNFVYTRNHHCFQTIFVLGFACLQTMLYIRNCRTLFMGIYNVPGVALKPSINGFFSVIRRSAANEFKIPFTSELLLSLV